MATTPARLLLLTARPELDVNRRLAEAAMDLGASLDSVDATRVIAGAGRELSLAADGRDLLDPLPDALLARVGNWRPDSVLAAVEVAERAGMPTPNPSHAIRRARDHWTTVAALGAAGLPVPVSFAGAEPVSLAAVAVARFGLPVVVKQRRSRMGVGVIRCDTRDHLEAVLDSLWRVGDEVLVQRFVEVGEASLRLLVVGGRVVAAARFRAAAGEWRSNAARGGRVEPWQPSVEECRFAVDAAHALELGLAGVDLLAGADGPVVIEVNPTPGFRALESATGIDVAGAIVKHLLGR